ncbi:TonB-dependent receptor plug domain-containing protein [Sphingobium algorifonticola]|uniref:TonB-dependent receptor n=1 Tax=Sphingobium algorifonticola TaxID=2008318 RepID=A0A437JBC4_9SPHN|nr:TonB-dependent receptor [Sphingobium algorifonticola]RVT43185.1 TonB-dependent receptor [Sphingobium algorifonticola]
MKRLGLISGSALCIALCHAAPAVAQDAVTPQAAAEEPGATIIVTGTRRTDRTVAESAVPVDVFTAETLSQQASGDMNNVLRNLIPSFNVGRFAIADGSTFVRPPTLRGLPPDQILVLVNGKRRHRAALVQIGGGALAAGAQGVDLAQIPTIAIGQIEVLRDGAAAQYGSDAIAGVINYGLKRDSSGFEVNTRYGQYYEGDGENIQISANAGFKLTDAGFFNISGEYLDSKQTSRGVQRPGALILSQQAGYADVRDPVQIWGDPQVEAQRVFFNSGIEISDQAEIYMFGNYGRSKQEGDFNYRQPISVTGPNALGTGTATFAAAGGIFDTPLYLDTLPGVFDSRGRPVYDAEGRTASFTTLYPQGFTPRFYGKVVDISIAAGIKGQLSFGLNYDLSASYGQNRIGYRMTETMNPSLGLATPTEFYMGSLEQRETNFNADFSYDFDMGLASPLTLAFGGEHRREGYIIGLGDPASYQSGSFASQTVQRDNGTQFVVTKQLGSNGFPGYGPDSTVDQARTSYAFYGEVDADVVEGLSLSAALRHENFSDFGSTTNWKATGRYAFTDAIAVRGAASTGFRAPTPGQLFTTNVATAFTGPNPIESAIYPVSTAAAQAFGATALQPEKSKNLSAGFVLTPASAFTLTVDAYQIKVTDRIGLTGNIEINTEQRRQALRNAGVANAETLGRVRYFTNSFDTRTRGVDVVASYTMTSGWGRFNTTLAGNYNKTKVTRVGTVNFNLPAVTGTPAAVVQTAVIDAVRVGNIENLNPKWRGNLTENWSLDALSIMARANYFGKYTSFAATADGGNKTFGSEFTFDLEIAYELTENIRLAVGAENIFDQYPDKNYRSTGLANQNWYQSTGGTIGGSVYPDDSPLGFNGGFWYARANFKF